MTDWDTTDDEHQWIDKALNEKKALQVINAALNKLREVTSEEFRVYLDGLLVAQAFGNPESYLMIDLLCRTDLTYDFWQARKLKLTTALATHANLDYVTVSLHKIQNCAMCLMRFYEQQVFKEEQS